VSLPVDTAKFRFRENGRKIRRARHLIPGRDGRPISQDDFAVKIGTGRRHMIKLENGEHRPSGPLRDRIVEVSGTTEQIESSDDEEEDMLLELINSLIRQRQHKIKTGDPYAVLK
jgi:transcriptional regulator with XRE-family HTH domain